MKFLIRASPMASISPSLSLPAPPNHLDLFLSFQVWEEGGSCDFLSGPLNFHFLFVYSSKVDLHKLILIVIVFSFLPINKRKGWCLKPVPTLPCTARASFLLTFFHIFFKLIYRTLFSSSTKLLVSILHQVQLECPN